MFAQLLVALRAVRSRLFGKSGVFYVIICCDSNSIPLADDYIFYIIFSVVVVVVSAFGDRRQKQFKILKC